MHIRNERGFNIRFQTTDRYKINYNAFDHDLDSQKSIYITNLYKTVLSPMIQVVPKANRYKMVHIQISVAKLKLP
jgi:hypothetical protein